MIRAVDPMLQFRPAHVRCRTVRYGSVMTRNSRAAERRQRIIRSAITVFAERGYAASSTAQIAAEAGVSKETIYSYFGNKAGLLREALLSLVAAPGGSVMAEPAGGVASSAEFRAQLGSLAMGLVTDLTQPQYLALARIVVAETPRDPLLPELFREAIAGRVLSGVVSMVAAGQRAGLVDADVDATTAARAFVGPLLTFVLLDGLLRPPAEIRRPTPDAIEAQVAFFCRAIGATTDHH
jgi:TetR/AcrR family transcriptional repressor of mexJK operon